MSIVNVYLPKDRQSAICVSDTLNAIDHGRSGSHWPKFTLLPHINTVLLHRGSLFFSWFVNQYVSLAGYADFDHLSFFLPRFCRLAVTDHENNATFGVLEGAALPELAAVGWSTRAGGFQAMHYESRDGFAPCEQAPGLRPRPAPGGHHLPAGDLEPQVADLIALAEVQLEQSKLDFGPDQCTGTGGTLTMIELGLDGAISVRPVHRLGSYAGDALADLVASAWWRSMKAPATGAAA